MLAAKNITSTDITFALPRRNWSNGTIYDMYQHNYNSDTTSTSGATNLYDSTFFFMTSDYNVYKVLDNNGGAAYNGAEPTDTSNSPVAIGGYVIKYMYTISQSDSSKYLTTDFIPVSTNSTVSALPQLMVLLNLLKLLLGLVIQTEHTMLLYTEMVQVLEHHLVRLLELQLHLVLLFHSD